VVELVAAPEQEEAWTSASGSLESTGVAASEGGVQLQMPYPVPLQPLLGQEEAPLLCQAKVLAVHLAQVEQHVQLVGEFQPLVLSSAFPQASLEPEAAAGERYPVDLLP
jgi:hypothetical protein